MFWVNFVNRRVGGLEDLRLPAPRCVLVNRRVGGLEDVAPVLRQELCVNRRVGGLEGVVGGQGAK